MSNRYQTSGFIFGGFVAIVICMLAVGWVMNIFKILSLLDNSLTVESVIRVMGIIIVPIGGIAGYF